MVIVRGGDYFGDPYTEFQFGDGTKLDFKTAFKYKDIVITAYSVNQTVGVDNVDDEDDYDCLYNLEEKVVKFKTATKPADGTPVTISGSPYAPVLIEARDQPSIDTYGGEFTERIVDERISTKESARERANAELITYADKISEANFTTYELGLLAGQQINVQSDIRNLDEDFIINRVVTGLRTPSEFIYNVSLVTTKSFGIIEFLSKILMMEDQRIEVREGETIEKLWTLFDTFTVQEEVAPVFKREETGPWYVGDGSGDRQNASGSPVMFASFFQVS